MTAYIIFRLILALFLGAVWYMLDRRFGTGWYRWWYGMTHEHPLPADQHRGFIHNRSTKTRVFFAVLLSCVISVIAIMYGDTNSLMELALWLLSIPTVVAAFIIGPRAYALWGKRDNVYDTVDKWERGEIDITNELKSKGSEIAAGVRESVTSTVEHISQSLPRNQEPVPPPKVEAEPVLPEPEIDPQERVNRFINRGQS